MAKGSKDGDILFEYDDLQSLFSNDHVRRGHKRYITADIALHGSDRFVIGVWYGMQLIEIQVIEKSDGKEVVDEIKRLARKHKVIVSNIIYDGDGLGAYLGGYLKGAKAFNNGGKALNDENYLNLKSQCFYHLSKPIKKGQMAIKTKYYKKISSENWSSQKG